MSFGVNAAATLPVPLYTKGKNLQEAAHMRSFFERMPQNLSLYNAI